MKCCANCFWSIFPTLEKYIVEENGYSEDDSNRTKVGDCCIDMKDKCDENFCCPLYSCDDNCEEEKNIKKLERKK